jgi:hypothetical protein
MRWMGHVACKVEMANAYRIVVGKPEDHSQYLGVDGKMMLIPS